MSLNGWQQTALEQERREKLRLQQVRRQCRALLAACEQETAATKDPAVQQLAADGLKAVQAKLKRAAQQIDQKPDQALKGIKAAQKQLHRVIADAEAAARQWSKQQAESKARIAETRARIEAEKQNSNKAAEADIARASDTIARAASLQQAGQYTKAIGACEEAEVLLQDAAKAEFEETVRREVVCGLLSTLKGMGFVVEGPQLRNGRPDGGVVTLVGQMPSGKRARFEIHVDGRMEFDLDGYAGRACAAELEQIGKTLHDRFGVKLGPAQVTWKNPDRIAKGARDLPSGGGRQIGCS